MKKQKIKQRILHLSSEYPPQKVFGLGRFVYDLATNQAALGHEVHVVTNSIGGKAQDTIDNGVNVHRVFFPPPPKPADDPTTVVQFNVQLIERVGSLLNEMCCMDIINAHDWLTALAGNSIRNLLSAKLIVTIHDTIIGKRFGELSNADKFVANIEKWICNQADKVICCSEYVKAELLKIYGTDDEKVSIIPCGVSEGKFTLKNNKHLGYFRSSIACDDEKIVLYVGRLDREKGLDALINCVKRVTYVYPQVKFVITGSGTYEDSLRKFSKEAGIEKFVIFTGYLSGSLLTAMYKVADLLAVPSAYEPFGIVALEGMINKLPVITSDSTGLGEIIDHEITGLKFDAGDSQSLAHSICRILFNNPFAESISAKGYQKAKKSYNWKGISERTCCLFEEAISE